MCVGCVFMYFLLLDLTLTTLGLYGPAISIVYFVAVKASFYRKASN